jgi:hypothetical protein
MSKGFVHPIVSFSAIDYTKIASGAYFVGFNLDYVDAPLCRMDNTGAIDIIGGGGGGGGTSGTSGTSGTGGTAGTSGTDGSSGTSGSSGSSGVDGSSGSSGTSGVDGTSGNSGTSGTSGTSGVNGTSGSSGTSGLSTRSFGITIDGGGSPITTGIKGDVYVPVPMTITGWTLVADQVGDIQIDVWKDTYSAFPPTVADSIAGTELPTLTSQDRNQDNTLTTWTTALSVGDVIRFNVDSASTVTRVTLSIYGS